jgi:CMP-N-acetylneuraminic acid synthetase
MKSEAVAIIPARGGSKRIPKKNLKFLWQTTYCL